MESLPALDVSSARFVELVAAVDASQWTASTPCSDWNVRDLVGHVVTTMIIYRRLLAGATRADVAALWADQRSAVAGDPVMAASTASGDERRAFAQPGALDVTVQHPIGEISGAELLAMRISENVLHTWDLASAIGADPRLDPEIVDLVYERMAPIGERLATTGHFARPHGPRPSGRRLDELLYLVGRTAAPD